MSRFSIITSEESQLCLFIRIFSDILVKNREFFRIQKVIIDFEISDTFNEEKEMEFLPSSETI